MTDAALPGASAATGASRPARARLAELWPVRRAMPDALPVLAVLAGLAGAVLLPDVPPGAGVLLTGLAVGAAVLPAARHRLRPHELGYAALATLLLSVVAVRDAPWAVALCLLSAAGLASYALAPGRGFQAGLLGGVSLPLAALRLPPWLDSGLRPRVPGLARAWLPVLRSAGLTVLLLLVFASLFAAADAAFAQLLPRVDVGLLPARAVTLVVVTGLTTAAAYLAANPPRWDDLEHAPARPVRLAEWAVPIALLDALFLGFVVVQVAVLFGGHRHVLETAGLTYAEYARSGFAALVVVTVLTLSVVAATARWAPRATSRERLLLRGLVGVLCLLTLAVVGSALYRLHLYEEAFGFTRLRLFMNAFEAWLGVVIVLVVATGVRLRATWLPRAVVASAAVGLLTLAAANPDAVVAARNVDRYAATGRLDRVYLQGLSADAVPAVDRLPEPVRSCVLAGMGTAEPDRLASLSGLAGWNLGRARAADLLDRRPVQGSLLPGACAG